MKNTHTPGPSWVVDVAPDANQHFTIRPNDGTCYGNTEEEPIATVYTKRDARLIAAAPNSIAANRRALSLLDSLAKGHAGIATDSDTMAVRCELHAAIAKAEGNQS